MLVFDKWTCKTNGRQTLFLSELDSSYLGALPTVTPTGGAGPGCRTFMIDQGLCFSAGDWKFPDAPLRGLYSRNRVYEGITGMQSFRPWLERLERRITERVLDDVSRDIPSEWYGDAHEDLLRLLEQLFRRRVRVPELLLNPKKSNRSRFLTGCER
jgi:hypothetical protein